MKQQSINIKYVLRIFGHCFFAVGLILLCLFSYQTREPINIGLSQKLIIISCFFVGYLFVFFEWIQLAKCQELYRGKADAVPGYLTKKLYGAYPYLFTFGKTNSSNQKGRHNWFSYSDQDVANKSFRDIFCFHINGKSSLILLMLAALLFPLILSDTPPSYLKNLVQDHFPIYVLYIYIICSTWLASIALIIFRLFFYKTYN